MIKQFPTAFHKVNLLIIFCIFSFLILFLPSGVCAESNFVEATNIQGLVKAQPLGNADWIKVEEGFQLFSGDKIKSFLESSVLLMFPDQSEFTLGENSFLEIKDVSENPRTKTAKRELVLNVGSLHYKVPPQEETASEFKVHSSTSIVGITGTEGVITADGEDKPTENILIEGSTYNTDEEGGGGIFQTEGNVYSNDGEETDMYGGDVEAEMDARAGFDEEYLNMIQALVGKYEAKKNENFDVGAVEHLINEAFVLLEQQDYEGIAVLMAEAERLLEVAAPIAIPVELQEKIEALFAEIEAKETEGVDLSEIYLLLDELHNDMEDGNFDAVEALLVSINQKLASLPLLEEGQGEGQGDAYLVFYEELQVLILEKESKGFSLDEIKMLLRQSYVYYEAGDLSKATQLLQEAEENLQLALKDVSDALQQRIADIAIEVALKQEEGFNVDSLRNMLEEVQKLIAVEAFIEVQALVTDLEEAVLNLVKELSADWEVKLHALEEEIKYREGRGYELTGIADLLLSLEDFVNAADVVNIELIYNEIMAALEALGLPPGFEADWQDFQTSLEEKQALGFELKEITDLTDKIQVAIDDEDIALARKLLEKAKELLNTLEDAEPPTIQILTFEEAPELIRVEGFVDDNTQVDNVTVNNSSVELTEEGKFNYETIPNPGLTELQIVATDISGNVSPPIKLPITVVAVATSETGDVVDISVEYLESSFVVKGKFFPGAKVLIGDDEATCDGAGMFSVTLDPSVLVDGSVSLVGVNPDGSNAAEVNVVVADNWAPQIEVEKVYFSETVAPTLQLNPLTYTETSAIVSGSVEFALMANVEGVVTDLGGVVSVVKVSERDVDLEADGRFLSSFSLAQDQTSADVTAEDSAGNTAAQSVAFDAVFNPPIVHVLAEEADLNEEGVFSYEVGLTKEITEIVVELKDAEGNQITSEILPVSSILPPELDVTDVNYAQGFVTVTGVADPQVTVQDKNQALFTQSVEVAQDGQFTFSAPIPPAALDLILMATNIEGKVSEDVVVNIDPPTDDKAPSLFLSSPVFSGNTVTVSGTVEDDSGIASVRVNQEDVIVRVDGIFTTEVDVSDGVASIEVVVVDNFNNQTSEVIAIADEEAPTITISSWIAMDGQLIITGKAADNVGVKEVRLNKMPLVFGSGPELEFSYAGALSEDSSAAVIVAVDLFNNETTEGPRELQIPQDTTPPEAEDVNFDYGDGFVVVSGSVKDAAGLKAVYVNAQEVEVFDDGSFSRKITIEGGAPVITGETPAYENGKVTLLGGVALGTFTPAKINIEAEDLSGNRGLISSQQIAPYRVSAIDVFINEKIVPVDAAGAFQYEKGLLAGKKTLEVKAVDPFEVSAVALVELEMNVPVLELQDLEYNVDEKLVIIRGRAEDADSGLAFIAVNGNNIDFDETGAFTKSVSIFESVLTVTATDYVGNASTQSKTIKAPDIWPPVFSVNVSPIPAVIGNQVQIEVTSIDSQTTFPEMLTALPTITAKVDGSAIPLQVQGEGSNFVAILDTAGLNPSLVNIDVSGTDQAGNSSTESEGTTTFALVEADKILPSFSIEVTPDPLQISNESTIKVFVSEELKTDPSLEAIMPSGALLPLALKKNSAQEYGAVVTPAQEESLGDVTLRLTGGEDLSGNAHTTTEIVIKLTAPVQNTEIPLRVDSIEFKPERFMLRGTTAGDAIVHIEIRDFILDIVANEEGKFIFERSITPFELEEMHAVSPIIRVRLKAHNYAGFESPTRAFEVDIPEPPEVEGEHFMINVNPQPVEQGGLIDLNIEVLAATTEQPQGYLVLSDGKKVLISLSGGNVLNGQYQLPEDAALGTAMFEVVAGAVRENVNFQVVLSSAWMQRLNKDDFYRMGVTPDPMIVGQEAMFNINTMADLDHAPLLQLVLPDGQAVSVPLSGGGRSFQGRYAVPLEAQTGGAELILNPGAEDEVRRPAGVEEPFSETGAIDAFLFSNPNPLLGGSPYEVGVNFAEPVSFMPQLFLKLGDGRRLELPLAGGVPSNRFSANGNLPEDIMSGLAFFILKDDMGQVIDKFSANIAPPLTMARGVDIFVMPDFLKPGDRANIQVNVSSPINDKLKAHVAFADGTKLVIPLGGDGLAFNGSFEVPQEVAFGMVTITVFDEARNSLGTARAEVVDQGHEGGAVRIFVDPPEFMPGDLVRVGVEANWPLPFVPKAVLNWEGGSINIAMRGNVPGNRFSGEFNAPSQMIERGLIEVKDDQGFMLGEWHIENRPEGEGDVIITPMPPVIGQPLSIKVMAPSMIDSAPNIRLMFKDGSVRDLNAYGAIPGDTFIASLDQLQNPLAVIEIVHDGMVVSSIPVENLDNRPPLEFDVEPAGEMVPGATVDMLVRANVDVPFIPRLSVDFQGTILDVPLAGVPFGREFFGKMTIPADAMLDNMNVMMFDPQGQLLWQRMFSQKHEEGGFMFLNIMPAGDNGFDLTWDMMRGVDMFVIRYGDHPGMDKKIEVRGNNFTHIEGLDAGKTYYFQVAAFMRRREIMASDMISAISGQTQRMFYAQFIPMGDQVQLMWDEYPGADNYRVVWGRAPGALEGSFDTNNTNHLLTGLIPGNTYFISVLALQAGVEVTRSMEMVVVLFEERVDGFIDFVPEQQNVGEDFEVFVHFTGDVSFMPEIIGRSSQGDVFFEVSGEKRDFRGFLSAERNTKPLDVVDVMDSKGMMVASRPVGMGGDVDMDSMLPIFVTPDPPEINKDMFIKINFSQPSLFVPRFAYELAEGRREEMLFSGSPNMSSYEAVVSGEMITSSVMFVEVMNPQGIIIGESFFGQMMLKHGPGVDIKVNPYPPVSGQDLTVDMDFGGPVDFVPKMFVELEDGRRFEQVIAQSAGLAVYTTVIPASAVTPSIVKRIEVQDDGGMFLDDWLSDVHGRPGDYFEPAPLNVYPDPPMIGQSVDMDLEVPDMVTQPPMLRIKYDTTEETVSMQGATPGKYFKYQIAQLQSSILMIDVINPSTNEVKFTWMPGGSPMGPVKVNIMASSDHPSINQDLSVTAEFDNEVPFTPKMVVYFDDGSSKPYVFPQAANMKMYQIVIPGADIQKNIVRIE
ncbi:FecR domain-containing protein, partial [Candidatus Omnitrophota bacterium]